MDFKDYEAKAFNGEYLPYDDLPPAEYKYFARIAELGRGIRAGKYSQNQAVSLRSEYYSEYQRTHERYSWTNIIKLTESLRVNINGSDDPAFIAALALRAVYLITGDEMIGIKMREMERRYEARLDEAGEVDSTLERPTTSVQPAGGTGNENTSECSGEKNGAQSVK